MNPKRSSQEYNYGELEGKARSNDPGVYFHPSAGKFVETAGVKRPDGSVAHHQDTGRIQADAFAQLGYRPASPEELKEYQAKQADQAKAQKIAETRTTTVL